MADTSILINIQSVFVVQKTWNFHPSWVTEFTNHISGIAKQNDYRVIAIEGTPDPIHLLIKLKPGLSFCGQPEDVTNFWANYPNTNGCFEGHFKWRAGHGFTHSISRNGDVSLCASDKNNHLHSDWLIDKYLEFLTKFNTAYDDDLFLNMSYCMVPSSLSMRRYPTIPQKAAV